MKAIVLVCLGLIVASASAQPIDRQQLSAMIKAELRDAYRPGNDDNYLAAHASLENYFATTDTKQRSAIVTSLEKTGIDPNLLGRLARLRADWPALTRGGVTEVEDHVGPIKVHYFLAAPAKYDRTIAWPLVVKLAERSAFAANSKPSADELRRTYTNWVNQELSHHPTAIVLMPVMDLDTAWGPSYQGMNAAIGALQHAMSRANIDPTHVYLIGHGTSGHAVLNLATLYPTYFTAINSLAAGPLEDWQRSRLTDLHNLLIVQWQDASDKVVHPEVAKNLFTELHRLNVDINDVETQNIGHDPTQLVIDQCYNAILSRQRALYPRHIELDSDRPETQFNRIDWLQVYQPGNGGDERKIFFKRVPGSMTIMANPWSASAMIAGNRIEITTQNVSLLRLYLNDQMVDLHQPVIVSVNYQTRFNGVVATSVKQMLNDQIFLGRGWRYFSGVIDIDLSQAPTTATTSQ